MRQQEWFESKNAVIHRVNKKAGAGFSRNCFCRGEMIRLGRSQRLRADSWRMPRQDATVARGPIRRDSPPRQPKLELYQAGPVGTTSHDPS
jgi:hypothetical protein